METILWKSPSDWGGADDLVRKIKELINENYSILNVVPLEYYGSNVTRIQEALIIVKKN